MDLGQFDKGTFLVNLLAIIYNPKDRTILIGKRENDPHVPDLSWVFPGGRPDYERDLEENLLELVKTKSGLDIEIEETIFAKTYPEMREFLSIYYLTKVVGGTVKAGEELVELKWVKPTEVESYFTTSFHPTLKKYLKSLE
jgi:ADP-ribose pyrophosphatase YjhB (NUDIX family)